MYFATDFCFRERLAHFAIDPDDAPLAVTHQQVKPTPKPDRKAQPETLAGKPSPSPAKKQRRAKQVSKRARAVVSEDAEDEDEPQSSAQKTPAPTNSTKLNRSHSAGFNQMQSLIKEGRTCLPPKVGQRLEIKLVLEDDTYAW
jgi:outer membrane biosynthesis protein TonB